MDFSKTDFYFCIEYIKAHFAKIVKAHLFEFYFLNMYLNTRTLWPQQASEPSTYTNGKWLTDEPKLLAHEPGLIIFSLFIVFWETLLTSNLL